MHMQRSRPLREHFAYMPGATEAASKYMLVFAFLFCFYFILSLTKGKGFQG